MARASGARPEKAGSTRPPGGLHTTGKSAGKPGELRPSDRADYVDADRFAHVPDQQD
jgi:hypothetical protein